MRRRPLRIQLVTEITSANIAPDTSQNLTGFSTDSSLYFSKGHCINTLPAMRCITIETLLRVPGNIISSAGYLSAHHGL